MLSSYGTGRRRRVGRPRRRHGGSFFGDIHDFIKKNKIISRVGARLAQRLEQRTSDMCLHTFKSRCRPIRLLSPTHDTGHRGRLILRPSALPTQGGFRKRRVGDASEGTSPPYMSTPLVVRHDAPAAMRVRIIEEEDEEPKRENGTGSRWWRG